MESVTTFGRVLTEQRKKRGMSRSQLAEAAELSYPYVSQLETGLRKPSRDAAKRLSRALGLSLLDLESTIPANSTPGEIRRANSESERLLRTLERSDSVAPIKSMPAFSMRTQREHHQGPSDREVLIGQLVDLIEEFPENDRLEVLVEVQKAVMRRMLDQRS